MSAAHLLTATRAHSCLPVNCVAGGLSCPHVHSVSQSNPLTPPSSLLGLEPVSSMLLSHLPLASTTHSCLPRLVSAKTNKNAPWGGARCCFRRTSCNFLPLPPRFTCAVSAAGWLQDLFVSTKLHRRDGCPPWDMQGPACDVQPQPVDQNNGRLVLSVHPVQGALSCDGHPDHGSVRHPPLLWVCRCDRPSTQ